MTTITKPQKKHVYMRRSEGRFYVGSDDIGVQYTFYNLPEGIKFSYGIHENEDSVPFVNDDDFQAHEDIIEAVKELKSIIDKYLYNSDKRELPKLIAFLEANEQEQMLLFWQYRKELSEYQIAHWQNQLRNAESGLRSWSEEATQ